jgi:valyl-tRNA synthetase
MGQRHHLDIINILTDDAKIKDTVDSAYVGMDRFEARKQIVTDLDGQGLIETHMQHGI